MAKIKVHTQIELSTVDIANAIAAMPQYEIAELVNQLGYKMTESTRPLVKRAVKSGIINQYGKEFLDLLK